MDTIIQNDTEQPKKRGKGRPLGSGNRNKLKGDSSIKYEDRQKVSDLSLGSNKAFGMLKAEINPKGNNIGYGLNDYRLCMNALNQYYMNHALTTGNMVVLPNGMGKLIIKKFKKSLIIKDGKTNLAIDWGHWKKTGKFAYHTNEHTGGNSFRWAWIKDKTKLSTANVWLFKMGNQAKVKLKNYVTQNDDWDKFNYLTDARKEYLIHKREASERKWKQGTVN